MKSFSRLLFIPLLVAAAWSCGKDDPVGTDPGKVKPEEPVVKPDPPAPEKVVDYDKFPLKDLAAKAGIKLGVSFVYWEYRNNPAVQDILKRDFAAVTFGNEMKHDAIVQENGRYRFTQADEMAGWAKACGTELFGHTLGWHSQQQRTYLNALIANASKNNAASLLKTNWNFESGTLDGYVASGFEAFTSLYDVFAGDYAAKAVQDGASLQLDVDVEAGKTYTVSFWAKSLGSEGAVEVVSGDGQGAQTRVSSQWSKYSVSLETGSVGGSAYRIVCSKDVVVDNIRVIGDGSVPSGDSYIHRPPSTAVSTSKA